MSSLRFIKLLKNSKYYYIFIIFEKIKTTNHEKTITFLYFIDI